MKMKKVTKKIFIFCGVIFSIGVILSTIGLILNKNIYSKVKAEEILQRLDIVLNKRNSLINENFDEYGTDFLISDDYVSEDYDFEPNLTGSSYKLEKMKINSLEEIYVYADNCNVNIKKSDDTNFYIEYYIAKNYYTSKPYYSISDKYFSFQCEGDNKLNNNYLNIYAPINCPIENVSLEINKGNILIQDMNIVINSLYCNNETEGDINIKGIFKDVSIFSNKGDVNIFTKGILEDCNYNLFTENGLIKINNSPRGESISYNYDSNNQNIYVTSMDDINLNIYE